MSVLNLLQSMSVEVLVWPDQQRQECIKAGFLVKSAGKGSTIGHFTQARSRAVSNSPLLKAQLLTTLLRTSDDFASDDFGLSLAVQAVACSSVAPKASDFPMTAQTESGRITMS
ncbi:hypothetical protein MTO96_046285 [Rhipicephalus appendiculatus]